MIYAIAVLVVVRFGLVPLAVGAFTVDMLLNVPLTLDVSAWYFANSFLALLSIAALATWGFYQSLGGAPIWRPELE